MYAVLLVSTGLINVLLTPLYARSLTKDEVALITVASSLVALLAAISSLALENAAHRWYWDTDDDARRRGAFTAWARVFFVLSLLLTGAVLPFSGWIADLSGVPEGRSAVMLLLLTVPLRVGFLVTTNWYRARRQVWRVFGFVLVQLLVTVGASIALLARDASASRAALAQLLGFVAASLLVFPAARGWWNSSTATRQLLREMLRFSMPLIPAVVASWALALADRGLLAWLGTPDDVAEYQIGVSASLVVALPVLAFQQAWGPFGLSISKRPDAERVYTLTAVRVAYGLGAVVLLFALISDRLVVAVFGDDYRRAGVVAVVLALGQFAFALFSHASLGFSIVKKTKVVAAAVVVAAVVNVALCLALAGPFGAAGTAWATALAQVVMAGILVVAVRRSVWLTMPAVRLGVIMALVGALSIVLNEVGLPGA